MWLPTGQPYQWKFQADVTSKIMAAKVRLAGNKLCENALEVCSETEAVSDNTVNNELCGFQQVSHIDGNFQADVTSKIMMAKVRLAGNKLCENGLEVCR